jgi:hypothetical protein
VPPASSSAPEAGVTQALQRRIASTFCSAPANVAAAISGATYLRAQHSRLKRSTAKRFAVQLAPSPHQCRVVEHQRTRSLQRAHQ